MKSMVGAEEVKEQFAEFMTDAEVAQLFKDQGQSLPKDTLHSVIAGNPGTGKTRVARAMADVYYGLGLVEKDVFLDRSASDFIASYEGQTVEKTKKILKEAEGGVLFIDEAHNLLDSSYGKEVIGVLTPFLTDHAGDTAVILGGYSDRIPELLKVDPGWSRRFPTKIEMNDYDRKQRAEIARSMASEDGYELKMSDAKLQELVGDTDPVENAGSVQNMMQKARRANRRRVMAAHKGKDQSKIPLSHFKELRPEDFA